MKKSHDIDKERILFFIHKMRGQAMGSSRSDDRDMDMGRLEASVELCTSEIVKLLDGFGG